jgi:hypothetical protein
MHTSFEPVLIDMLNQQRISRGFYSLAELLELHMPANIIFDPFSTLISRTLELGSGNIFYPNVIIETQADGRITIGHQNTFFPNTLLRASSGHICIGSGNIFGEGGVSLVTSSPEAQLLIGDTGRYCLGAQISGSNHLGHGAQVLGAILVQGCELGDGASYTHSDPDQRGGVLKGAGLARNLRVGQGEVINGRFNFTQAAVERQRVYHPK